MLIKTRANKLKQWSFKRGELLQFPLGVETYMVTELTGDNNVFKYVQLSGAGVGVVYTRNTGITEQLIEVVQSLPLEVEVA
ncbi:hypothetical protein LCGC14_0895050 [marine sediment metagenome]|uniref:Uncharacterized protein n=1 Tax=marine sediment metagenome TaxID=412755 RepID=A0A0F9NY67_9ZZZZ